jgi:transposase
MRSRRSPVTSGLGGRPSCGRWPITASRWSRTPHGWRGGAALGLDETSFLKATRRAPTRYVTGLVDLEGGRLLEVVADRTRAAVHGWLGAQPAAWLVHVDLVALDPCRGYANALVTPLGHARVVVDHFHAIRLANVVVDQARRRVQQATLGHRGHKRDPLYRIRKLLLVAAEQLTSRGRARLRAGLAVGARPARWRPPGRAKSCCGPSTPRSTRRRSAPRWSGFTVGQTASGSRSCPGWSGPMRAWEGEILAFHVTNGCSNGPTEAMSLLIKKVKRVGHGFRSFTNYRLRLLLHCGVAWQTHRTARLRGRSPRFVA